MRKGGLMAEPEKLGQLFISEKVIEMIAYRVLLEVEGLYTPDRVKGGGLWGTLSKAYQGTGIQVLKGSKAPAKGRPDTVDPEAEKELKIKLSLIARYGMPIQEAAEQAIRGVRRKVKELAGLDVSEVEVEITGIVKMP